MNGDYSENDSQTHQVVPMYVSPNHRESALKDLQDFVEAFAEDDIQNRITQAIETCLISDSHYFAKPIERENLLYTMRNIAKSVRALYILFDRKVA